MNLPSETNGTMAAFAVSERVVTPFEFRSLTGEDVVALGLPPELRGVRRMDDFGVRDAAMRTAVEVARQEGLQQGDREGRRAARVEMEVEMRAGVTRERSLMVDAVKQFQSLREHYFAGVEQEVVRLALAIAARVLHREVQLDPLLLSGVVRVVLEKMADRSGVVLRVAEADVAAWEQVFHAMEMQDRPRVTGDAQLGRGECVLETKMGTVELGVGVQLQEIEKGFFDLLHHRPVE